MKSIHKDVGLQLVYIGLPTYSTLVYLRVETIFTGLPTAVVIIGLRREIEDNQQMLADAGHWGVPTFVVDGEPFFGQDRIDTLKWRLDQMGLGK
ncbi:MAG: DsbA family protein [Marinobacter sp.]|uniref:DsbA family protein n=1 Tax=Marinobacter sp. TaxID=50741 RepID=UPI00349FFCCD